MLAGENFFQLLSRQPAAVFANLEGFGVAYPGGSFRSVAARERRPQAAIDRTAPLLVEPFAPFGRRNFAPFDPWQPFVNLRRVRTQGVEFLAPCVIDINRDFRGKARRQMKFVLE